MTIDWVEGEDQRSTVNTIGTLRRVDGPGDEKSESQLRLKLLRFLLAGADTPPAGTRRAERKAFGVSTAVATANLAVGLASGPVDRWIASSSQRWFEYLSKRFAEIEAEARLGKTGYPSIETLNRAWNEAVRLLDPHHPTPSVVPSENAGVDLVWHKKGWDVEVEIEPGASTVWAHEISTGETEYGPLADMRSALTEVLDILAEA